MKLNLLKLIIVFSSIVNLNLFAAEDQTPTGPSTRRNSLSWLVEHSSSPDITIPAGRTVYIDRSVDVGLINVMGVLKCDDDFYGEIHTEGILVMGMGAKLICGTESAPFHGNAKFVLYGDRELSDIVMNPMHEMGVRAIAAMMGGEIHLHGKSGRSERTRINQHLNIGSSSAVLENSFPNWRADDEILITTTSFYHDRNEVFTLSQHAQFSNSLNFRENATYFHYGQTQQFDDVEDNESYVLDERAYVANLTRNILITAPDDFITFIQKLGAHMMIMHGAKGFIDSVEFKRVGQAGVMGRYPFHWHKAGDVSGQYIRNSSIHQSYNRCVTIHGTNFAAVTNNICYDHYGHGYFLEDGNEIKNVIQHNLGVYSRKPSEFQALLQSDINSAPADRFPGPATYWISNPDNDVRYNVAVGSEGSGFWMAFKKYLLCDSNGCAHSDDENANVRPINTDTLFFSDNTASSSVTGITWDGAPDGEKNAMNDINSEDRVLTKAHYSPRVTPDYKNLVMYKNSMAGLYFRGDQAHFTDNIMADNGTAIFVAYNQIIKDSMVLGFSDNHNQIELDFHRDLSLPNSIKNKGYFQGIRAYDGPFVLDNVFFANFSSEPIYLEKEEVTPTPIKLTGASMRYGNSVKHVTFSPTPYRKILMDFESEIVWQDSITASITDVLGDLTGTPGKKIYPFHAMNYSSRCLRNTLENTLICSHDMATLRLKSNAASTDKQRFDVYRNNGASQTFSRSAEFSNYNKFNMILGDDDIFYDISMFDYQGGDSIRLELITKQHGDITPIISISNILDSDCSISEMSLDRGFQAGSLEEFKDLNETSFFHLNGKFLFKLKADLQRENISAESAQGLNELNLICE